ncbi:AI-2E family transporter, partial [Elusimicrobiota bacterium]
PAPGLVVTEVKSFLSNEQELLVLRVRGQYKVNQRFAQAKKKLPKWTAREAEPLIEDINKLITLDPREQRLFESYMAGGTAEAGKRYYDYYLKNLELMKGLGEAERLRERTGGGESSGADEGPDKAESFVAAALGVVSIWVVMPFVFLFLLFDQGQIIKRLVAFVPNKYFEVTLMVVHNVDKALGAYLRGVTLECGLVGMTFVLCLWLCGIDLRVALAVGAVAGAANAIPFLGPAIGLVVGVAYALVAEDISPIIPFITVDNLIGGVVITVAIAQTLDNVYFQPIVLGTAVDLHPLLVIFGVMGGSILFGLVGMLFAIPSIVIVKVVLSTLFREFKAYYLI